MKVTFSLTLILLFTITSQAADITGYALDKGTKEALIGATVYIKELKSGSTVGLDGSYHIKDVKAGSYNIVCSYIGYETVTKTVKISKYSESIKLNFELSESYHQLGEVVISGVMDQTTDEYARKSERNADYITNIMSAKTIQLMPDINVANLLRRFSGVAIERGPTGSASYAVIRGMDQRYNVTLVNGIKIPSPDNKYRYVPMNLFPSDLLDRLEVSKTLTPSMEGDATGGTMNMIMKDAPDHLSITANVGTGINTMAASRGFQTTDFRSIPNKSPEQIHGPNYVADPTKDFNYKNFDYKNTTPINQLYGFSVGNRIGKKKKLGLILATSYQNLNSPANSFFLNPNTQPNAGNVPTFDDIYLRQYSTKEIRRGAHLKGDYRIDKNNKLSFYQMYISETQDQIRHTTDTSTSIGRSIVGTGNVYLQEWSRKQTQSIYNSTIQGEHSLLNGLKIDWSGVYSNAQNRVPNWSNYQTSHRQAYNLQGQQTTVEYERLYSTTIKWLSNDDTDLTGYLNLHKDVSLGSQKIQLSAGGLYRSRVRHNNYNEYKLTTKTNSTGQPPHWSGTLTGDQLVFNSDQAAKGATINPNTYTAYEKIAAAYFQFKMNVRGKLEIIAGPRVEFTNQSWKTVMPKSFVGRFGSVKYYDILPSINTKYRITDNQNLRLSYFKSLNRAGFFELIPYNILGDYYNEFGNYNLLHARIHNFDLRYEFFPKVMDKFLVGAFYKRIINPIETAFVKTGTSSAGLQPQNFGTATNYGLEVSVVKYWGSFGISGNYTYTHSRITTPKQFLQDNNEAIMVQQSRPLQGQAPNIGNLSLLYKNQKNGLDFQLAGVYTGEMIKMVSLYYDLDYWQLPMLNLSASAEKKIGKHLTVYVKAQNLLNTPMRVVVHAQNTYQTGDNRMPDQPYGNKILTQRVNYGRTFLAGIRFKLD